ncbi:MAG: hypothetical protein ACFFD4_16890 [Candidatus Odinarchaeota archaeon]
MQFDHSISQIEERWMLNVDKMNFSVPFSYLIGIFEVLSFYSDYGHPLIIIQMTFPRVIQIILAKITSTTPVYLLTFYLDIFKP